MQIDKVNDLMIHLQNPMAFANFRFDIVMFLNGIYCRQSFLETHTDYTNIGKESKTAYVLLPSI